MTFEADDFTVALSSPGAANWVGSGPYLPIATVTLSGFPSSVPGFELTSYTCGPYVDICDDPVPGPSVFGPSFTDGVFVASFGPVRDGEVYTFSIAAVPEPGALGLVVVGFAGIFVARSDRWRVSCAALRAVAASIGLLLGVPAWADQPTDLATIVRNYAGSAVQDGSVIGAEVAVLLPGQDPKFFSFGFADAGRRLPPRPDTIFEIGSVTKVFTTNLLGQAASSDPTLLNKTLSAYQTQLGALPVPGPNIALWELGSFTAGYPTYAPGCASGQQPSRTGCLPGSRPTLANYTAQDFATFFRTTPPANQSQANNPLTAPPFPYFYSDYSTGLIGLLLGADPTKKLSNQALRGWNTLLHTELLQPLGMKQTALHPPQSATPRLAAGYRQALATAIVTDGAITGFKISNHGSAYYQPPRVSITGGGGSGATAQALVSSDNTVQSISPIAGGTGYIAPPEVSFSGAAATPADGVAVVRDGQIVAIRILQGGDGYKSAPAVQITGGQTSGGVAAQATASVRHGQVVFVAVSNGGSGYVDPLVVRVAPGGSVQPETVPIWAPAGALTSDVRDMAIFAAAALGRSSVGGHPIPQRVVAGFQIAEKAYACKGPDPALAGCTAGYSALAWDLLANNETGPAYLAKDGGLPGFSSYVALMPGQDMAVVVLVNSRQDDPTTRPSVPIGDNILWALYGQSGSAIH